MKDVVFLVTIMPKDGRAIFLLFTREERPAGVEPAVFLRVSSVEWRQKLLRKRKLQYRTIYGRRYTKRQEFRIAGKESFSMQFCGQHCGIHARKLWPIFAGHPQKWEIADGNEWEIADGMNVGMLAYLLCT